MIEALRQQVARLKHKLATQGSTRQMGRQQFAQAATVSEHDLTPVAATTAAASGSSALLDFQRTLDALQQEAQAAHRELSQLRQEVG